MNDYELLYYIYQSDDEALALLLGKYKRTVYFLTKRQLDKNGYTCETSSEFEELIQMGCMELYRAVFAYRDDLNCSFSSFAQKCIEMNLRKYLRTRRSQQNYGYNLALRLDEKVKDEEAIYRIDQIASPHHELEGDYILKWYHEESLLDYLHHQLNENEFTIIRMKIEGYSRKEIALLMSVNMKRVCYVIKKARKLLLRYID